MDDKMDVASEKHIVLPRKALTVAAVAVSLLAVGGAIVLIRYLDSRESRLDASLASEIDRIGVFSDQKMATATPSEAAEGEPPGAAATSTEGFDMATRDHQALMALLETPGLVAGSPKAPAEMQPFSLKPGESATVTFACGEGADVTRWTESVTVESIEKVPGDALIYAAKVKIGDVEHDVTDGTYRIDDGTTASVYFLEVAEDRVDMIVVRNAC